MTTLSDLVETTKRLLDAILSEVELMVTEAQSPAAQVPPTGSIPAPLDPPYVSVTNTPESTPPATFAESLAAESPAPTPDAVTTTTEAPDTTPEATEPDPEAAAEPVQTHAEALAADAALAAQNAAEASSETTETSPEPPTDAA